MKIIRLLVCIILILNLFVYIIFCMLPESWQYKIQTRGLLPHQLGYSLCLSSKLSSVRKQMCRWHNGSPKYGEPSLIAHTGGVGAFSYVTCVESLEDALQRGFRFIECDFYVTADDHLVAMHTLEELADLVGKSPDEVKKMTLSELKQLRVAGKHTVLSDEDVRRLMEENPDMVLVTDRIQDMELLKSRIFFPERMIVEVGSRYTYARALELGFKYPALTIGNKFELQLAAFDEIPLLVMDARMMTSQYVREIVHKLHDKKITIMIHHAPVCDQIDFIHSYLGRSCSMIYTNCWSPKSPPPPKKVTE